MPFILSQTFQRRALLRFCTSQPALPVRKHKEGLPTASDATLGPGACALTSESKRSRGKGRRVSLVNGGRDDAPVNQRASLISRTLPTPCSPLWVPDSDHAKRPVVLWPRTHAPLLITSPCDVTLLTPSPSLPSSSLPSSRCHFLLLLESPQWQHLTAQPSSSPLGGLRGSRG